MREISFLDKLKILVDVSSSSGVVAIILLFFLGILLITTNKKNVKSIKRLYFVIYLAITIILLIYYGSSLPNMFDYMMNHLFIAIYFPNLAIYLAAIIASNIILWNTVFNFKEDKLLRVVNIIVYGILHYLLILILNLITSNELNVFDQSSVYGNEKTLALIGLSSTVFIVWIIFMVIYKVIRSRQRHEGSSSVEYIEIPKVEYVEVPRLPSNILEVAVPEVVQSNKVPDVIPIDVYQKNLELKNEYEKNQALIKEYESMLTLEDYKHVLNLLKGEDTLNISNTVEVSTNDSLTGLEEKEDMNPLPCNTSSAPPIIQKKSITNQPILDQLLHL